MTQGGLPATCQFEYELLGRSCGRGSLLLPLAYRRGLLSRHVIAACLCTFRDERREQLAGTCILHTSFGAHCLHCAQLAPEVG